MVKLSVKYVTPEEARTRRGNIRYLDDLRQLARNNRKNQTRSELLIWDNLLRKNKLGFLFLRQKPIGKFILDFYCSKLLLAIEIDGASHREKKYSDFERDRYLEQRGIKTVRFKNEEILGDFEKIKLGLERIIEERKIELKSPFSQREI